VGFFFLGVSTLNKAIKQKKMVALKVLETSGVDHPAHLEEGWIVMKNAGNQTEETVSEQDETMEQGLEEAYIERVVELEKALSASNEELSDLKKAYDAKKADADETTEDEEDEDEDMMKSLPQPVREMLEKAEASANIAREELKKERDNRRDEQYVAKAAGWSHLTVDANDLGPALRRLNDIDATLGETIEKALESANAQAESASIFDEIGRGSRPSEGNAYAKVETLAKAAFVSGEYQTVEQAMTGVILKNPDLYADYRKEQ
jgi:hypothetical protein